MIQILLGLLAEVVSAAPTIIEAGADASQLIAGARTALNRIADNSPEYTTNDQFAALDAQVASLENRLQAAADRPDRAPPADQGSS